MSFLRNRWSSNQVTDYKALAEYQRTLTQETIKGAQTATRP
jgi:hypothetical protein